MPDGTYRSVTEQEYDEAVRKRIPRLLYIVYPQHPWPESLIEKGEQSQERLQGFKAKVEKQDVSNFLRPLKI
jgi:hypothetical protein